MLEARKVLTSACRVVRLHNCGGLSHAMLSNNSLEQLNFSACRGLRQLSLCCPNLHILQVRGNVLADNLRCYPIVEQLVCIVGFVISVWYLKW